MAHRTIRLFVAWLILSPLYALAADPYEKQIAPTEPLSAEEQLKTFHLPPGFEIQLVAAEPEIRKPINLAFDDAGRLYATQSEEYPFEAPADATPRDVVKRFEQFAVDGRAQKVTTAVTGLNIPIGVTPYGNDLIVFSIPNLYRCRDKDRDGVYEERQILYSGFGHRDTHGMVNNITPWMDGWIYCCHGFSNTSEVQGTDGHKITMQSGNTFRIRPDGSRVEYFTHGQVNPFGLAFDPLGNLYSSDCHTLPAYQLLRGAWYPSFGKPHDGLGFGPTIMSHTHGSTGIAGIVYYAADQFPADYRDTLFVGNPVTGRINHDKLERHGSSVKAIEQPDFVTCDDPWFRPVDLKLGPDGAIYVADFYNRIIGHYEVPLTHPKRDRERGRIWRIVYRGDKSKPALAMPDVAKASPAELIELLAHPSFPVRVAATNRLTHEKLVTSLEAELRQTVSNSKNEHQRAHALWVIEQGAPDGLDDALIKRLADDPAPLVRVHSLTILGERPYGKSSFHRIALVRSKLADTDPSVRRAAADALGRHRQLENIEPLLRAWAETPSDDTHLVHVIRMALRDHLLQSEYYNQLANLSVADHQRLADVSLGVDRPEAAAYLFDYLKQAPADRRPDSAQVEHVIRYCDSGRLAKFFAFTESYRSRPQDEQLTVVRAIHRAAQARGVKLPESIAVWELGLARTLLDGQRESDVQAGLDLARELRRNELHEDLLRLAAPDTTFPNLRPAAIDACVANDAAHSVPLLAEILTSDSEPMALRQKAAQALGNANNDAARRELLAQLKTAPERLSIEIAAGLAGNADGAEMLLTAVKEGKASARLLQELSVRLLR
jgi:glucose/arabinose dehydrogenase/HEAT repeat protein